MRLSSIIEKWDTIAFIGYNILAKALYYGRYPKINKYLKRNKEFRDKHKGERCFIVLNGPSLCNYDLSKISNEFVFCTNYFYQTNKFEIVKPNYYCVTDSQFFNNEDSEECIRELLKCNYSKFIFNINYLKKFKPNKNIYLTYSKHMPNILTIGNDLCKMSSGFISVSLFAMNTAIFMGFKEIYLLGYDFEPGILKHFYHDTDTEINNKQKKRSEILKDGVCGRYWQYAQAQYQNYYIKNLSDMKNIRIFNCNEQSYVRSFPFVDYESLFTNTNKED